MARKRKPFASVVKLTDGRFAVESYGARWGTHDTSEAATEQAARLNGMTDLGE